MASVKRGGGDNEMVDVVSLIPILRAFARKLCSNPVDADDLVQETLLKATASIDQYQPGTRLKSWLFTIMRNTFYNRIIIERRELTGGIDCVSSLPATPAPQEWALRVRNVERAVARLPAKQRDVLILVAIEGASYIRAAEICGCDIGTVKSRLSRSRARLLRELGGEDAGASI